MVVNYCTNYPAALEWSTQQLKGIFPQEDQHSRRSTAVVVCSIHRQIELEMTSPRTISRGAETSNWRKKSRKKIEAAGITRTQQHRFALQLEREEKKTDRVERVGDELLINRERASEPEWKRRRRSSSSGAGSVPFLRARLYVRPKGNVVGRYVSMATGEASLFRAGSFSRTSSRHV